MGLWDEDDDDDFELPPEEGNKYLEDPDRGIELISKLLYYDKTYNVKRKYIKKLDDLLDRKLLEVSEKISIPNELELYDKLINLSDKLYEQNKMKLLKNRSVIGIGGKFSAGKSKFINALLNNDILPEDQTPTTSIATYIVCESTENIKAYTHNDQDIPLDMEAAKALTHAFYEKYGLGFSQFINNLVINVPDFPYSNVALLDTPGYNKSDSGIKRSVSDAEKAYHQLKKVDFLVWLVDIENGVIQQPDIEFIQSLKIKNPILIVFNKADKKTESGIKDTVQKSKETLKNTGICIYDVIAYSALEEKEYLGTSKLESFMREANVFVNRKEDIEKQIHEIVNTIQDELNSQKRRMIDRRNRIGEVIFRSEDIMEVKTLVRLYSEVIANLEELCKGMKSFKNTEREINKLLTSMKRE